MNFRLQPHEKLKDTRSISYLFQNGKKFHSHPLLFLTAPLHIFDVKSSITGFEVQVDDELPRSALFQNQSKTCIKIAFTVPKKNFRKAVQRNRIKRMMREAYRLQKNHLPIDYKGNTKPVIGVLVIFIGREMPEYSTIFKAMKRYIDQF